VHGASIPISADVTVTHAGTEETPSPCTDNVAEEAGKNKQSEGSCLLKHVIPDISPRSVSLTASPWFVRADGNKEHAALGSRVRMY
jgi:hypothetical protein